MGIGNGDVQVLRELAQRYLELASQPVQEERRRLWAAQGSLRSVRPMVLATFGMHNVWCREVFADSAMRCQDPFYRAHERGFRMRLFQGEVGDDSVMVPWWAQGAAVKGAWERMWGVDEGRVSSDMEGGACKFVAPLKSWDDLEKLTVTHHEVDEAATEAMFSKLHDAIGDILPIDRPRTPALIAFSADISTDIAKLRGLDQLMLDMYESPRQLHELLAFMRDGILQNNQEAEDAGDWSLTSGHNSSEPYCEELEWPRPNSGPRKRKDLWAFCAAQEYTLVSPRFHDEFLFQYQRPICEHFGLVHYGCCEDLTRKIDMLRQLPNLRSIAVTPTANVRQCAEQIGGDYVISWRPNPTDMVCAAWDEGRVRRIIRDGLDACRGLNLHLHLKDVETVQGEPWRLRRWVEVVREEIER
jgi:hypothetical protein